MKISAQKCLPNFRERLNRVRTANSTDHICVVFYRSAEFPNSAFEKKWEFTIPTAEKNISFYNNILSHSDNASCKLAFIDAAEFGNSAEPREWQQYYTYANP